MYWKFALVPKYLFLKCPFSVALFLLPRHCVNIVFIAYTLQHTYWLYLVQTTITFPKFNIILRIKIIKTLTPAVVFCGTLFSMVAWLEGRQKAIDVTNFRSAIETFNTAIVFLTFVTQIKIFFLSDYVSAPPRFPANIMSRQSFSFKINLRICE